MKKFYSLTLCAAVSAYTFAADVLQPASFTDYTKSHTATVQTTKATDTGAAMAAKTRTAPMTKAHEFKTIDDVCTTYEWSYYSYLTGSTGEKSGEVTISRVDGSDTEVSIVGFYSTFPVTATVDMEKGTLTIPKQFMFKNTYYNKDVYFWYNYWNSNGQGNNHSEDPIVATFDSTTGKVVFEDYDNIVVGIPDLGYFLFAGSNMLTVPDEGNKLTIDMPDCTEDNKFPITLTLGANVASMKYTILPGIYQPTTANLNVIKSIGTTLPVTSTKLTYDGNKAKRDIYSILIAGLDAEGNVVAGDGKVFFPTPNEDDDWEDVTGAATYGEDFVNSIYQNFGTADYEVALQRHKTTAGYYRLVNPYGQSYAFASKNKHSVEHTHYVYVNASDPEKVVVEMSPLGYDLGDGTLYAWSRAAQQQSTDAAEADYEQYYGKYDADTRTITFPQSALLSGESRYENGKPYLANSNSAFKVVLPESLGVTSVTAEDAQAPAEYFNLQGVRIDNPTAGQLVIRRQGTTVTKMLVK